MLTYNLDISEDSLWIRTTPGPTALAQPYYVTEAGRFRAGRRFETSRTHKDSFLLFLTTEGEGQLIQGEHVLRMTPGTAVLIDCRTPQKYRTAPGADCWEHYWVHMDGAGVRALFEIIDPGGRPAAIPVSETLGEIFDHLLHRVEQETASAVLSASLDVHRILQRLASARLRELPGADRNHRELMETAADYIREHYAEDLHIETLLGITHLSRSYFLRLFRQHMGTTPYNFLLRTRVTRARELLEMTDLPVAVIAERVGFGNETNFSSRFSAVAGITPSACRRQAIARAGDTSRS